jgi:hypothetical protein
MANDAKAYERLHKATYSKDKRTGGYNIRVSGPNASKFAGREVPVTVTSGGEHPEKLLKLLWAGIEKTSEFGGKIGEPVALYSFESKPKEPEPDAAF